MKVQELVRLLQDKIDRVTNGVGDQVLDTQTEVLISTPQGIYALAEVDADRFDEGEPWVILLESGPDYE